MASPRGRIRHVAALRGDYLSALHANQRGLHNFRSIIVLPCLGAVAGALCWHYLGDGPLSIALATLSVLVAQMVLRAYMPPALALAALAPLLRVEIEPYVAGVAIGTSVIGAAFILGHNVLRKWSG